MEEIHLLDVTRTEATPLLFLLLDNVYFLQDMKGEVKSARPY